jgi:8-oxo-dGTP pyrophosphatase MutT (NUDIX family)
MGAGILPTTIHNNQLYFLFGKENQYADTPGWSDIGGGTDNNESFKETAAREGAEELTGFLGQEKDIKKLLDAHGTYNIDFDGKHSTYRIHIFPYQYDPMLPVYYNNNHKFLERKLTPHLVKTSKIFEKEEIRWISADDMRKMRGEFRHDIAKFIRKSNSKKRTGKKTPRARARGTKTRKKK